LNDQRMFKKVMTTFVQTFVDVYKQFTDEDLQPGGLEKLEENSISIAGIAVIVPFTGKLSGRVLLGIDKDVALSIYSSITGESVEDICDDVLFSMGEFGNMVTGNAVTVVNNEFKSGIRLAPPSVFSGDEMNFVNFKVNIYNIVFKTPHGVIRLNTAFKEEAE